jgi:SNF2 family DNA or RNA helicase
LRQATRAFTLLNFIFQPTQLLFTKEPTGNFHSRGEFSLSCCLLGPFIDLTGCGRHRAAVRALYGEARVDLNPHQVEAALFALRSPFAKGVLLADEVGLGKTIEAGIVLAQHWAEGRRRLLLIVPATLRKQWQAELLTKFSLPSVILNGPAVRRELAAGVVNPFERADTILIGSYPLAARYKALIGQVSWHLVVLDEAHRLCNVWQAGSKQALAIRAATRPTG